MSLPPSGTRHKLPHLPRRVRRRAAQYVRRTRSVRRHALPQQAVARCRPPCQLVPHGREGRRAEWSSDIASTSETRRLTPPSPVPRPHDNGSHARRCPPFRHRNATPHLARITRWHDTQPSYRITTPQTPRRRLHVIALKEDEAWGVTGRRRLKVTSR